MISSRFACLERGFSLLQLKLALLRALNRLLILDSKLCNDGLIGLDRLLTLAQRIGGRRAAQFALSTLDLATALSSLFLFLLKQAALFGQLIVVASYPRLFRLHRGLTPSELLFLLCDDVDSLVDFRVVELLALPADQRPDPLCLLAVAGIGEQAGNAIDI